MKTSITIQMVFTVGYMIMSLLTYFVRTWRTLLIIISIPSLLFAVSYIWFLDESPRWLLNKKKTKQARRILHNMAKMNKTHFPEKEVVRMSTVDDTSKVQIWKMFTIPQLLKRTIILMLNWAIISLVYFGLSLNVGKLYGNLYVNFFLNSVVEFPAYALCILLLNRVGRRKLHFVLMLLAGISCLSGIFPVLFGNKGHRWLISASSILGRLFITASFGIIYLYTLELYPTCIRNTALGALSTFARVGGSLAPYTMNIAKLIPNRFGRILPMVLMGVLTIVAGVASYLLPETNNRKMMDTFDDINETGQLELNVENHLNSNEETFPMKPTGPKEAIKS